MPPEENATAISLVLVPFLLPLMQTATAATLTLPAQLVASVVPSEPLAIFTNGLSPAYHNHPDGSADISVPDDDDLQKTYSKSPDCMPDGRLSVCDVEAAELTYVAVPRTEGAVLTPAFDTMPPAIPGSITPLPCEGSRGQSGRWS